MTRLSHSAIEKYKTCAKMYFFHYIMKLRGEQIGSPLFFGNAIDEALNCLLLRKKNENDLTEEEQELVQRSAIDVFNEAFRTIDYNDEILILGATLKARYSTADFDEDLLEPQDLQDMSDYLVANSYENHDGVEVMLELKKFIKQNGFLKLDDVDKLFYNYCNWLSLRRKGHMMIREYEAKILPLIKKVISIQKKIELPNEDGDVIIGYIDFEAILEGNDFITTCDNKTASKPYKEDSVETSPQLTIYCEATEREDAAYPVLVKKVRKTKRKTCKTCGEVTTKAVKKCAAGGTGKNRCNGELDIVHECSIDTQLIQGKITEEMKDITFAVIEDVLFSIRNEEFPKNPKDKCYHYGKRCCYWKRCWENPDDMEGLVCTKVEEDE